MHRSVTDASRPAARRRASPRCAAGQRSKSVSHANRMSSVWSDWRGSSARRRSSNERQHELRPLSARTAVLRKLITCVAALAVGRYTNASSMPVIVDDYGGTPLHYAALAAGAPAGTDPGWAR